MKCWGEAVGVSHNMVLGFPTKANDETGKINYGILQYDKNNKIYIKIKKYRIKNENKKHSLTKYLTKKVSKQIYFRLMTLM